MNINQILVSRIVNILKFCAATSIFYYHFFHKFYNDNIYVQWSFYGDTMSSFLINVARQPFDFHSQAILSFGHLGNALLFAISGWGLTQAYLLKGMNTFSWWTYLKKRSLRVLPLYYIAIIFFTIAAILRKANPDGIATSLISTIFFVHIISPATTHWLDGPLWFIPSLIVLYILFPFVYPFFTKHPHVSLVASIFVAFFSQLIIFFSPLNSYNPYFLMGVFPLVNVSSFGLGLCLAVLLVRRNNIIFSDGSRKFIIFFGVCCILIGLFMVDTPILYLQYPLFLMVGIVSVFLPAIKVIANTRFLGDTLEKLGSRSYALFLFHFPLVIWFIDIYRERNFMRYPAFAAAVLLIVIWPPLILLEFAVEKIISLKFKQSHKT